MSSTESSVSQAVVSDPKRTPKLLLTSGWNVALFQEAMCGVLDEPNAGPEAPKNFKGKAVATRSVWPAKIKPRLETGIWKLLVESSGDFLQSLLRPKRVQ
jgi:hypothetical protein